MYSEYKIARSFTAYHKRLMDIAFGRYNPDIAKEEHEIDFSGLDDQDMEALAEMVQVEFASSLAKEVEAPADDTKAEPHVFDIFLMERSLDRGNSRLAVCLPVRYKNKSMLMWHDGVQGNFWPLEPPSHIRRVASLSGAARILQSLSIDPRPLLMWNAMQRENIVDVIDIELAALDGMANLSGMNYSQKLAVATVSSHHFKEGFFVVQGPPGCGKTTTMVGIIEEIGQGVIVSAPSNAAVANVALKLHSKTSFNFMSLCVYGTNCDESVRFLNPVHRSTMFQQFCRKYNDEQADERQKNSIKREFTEWLHVREDCSIPELAAMCPFIDMNEKDGRDLLQTILSSSAVVFCTLNTAGSPFVRDSLGKQFQTLLLDEGGQCPEAEFYIATTFPGVRRIVVVGDPQQLPVTVIDPRCQRAGYGESWMGHIASKYPAKVHLLDTQYRMDPEILKFPNNTFYSKRILSGDNVFGRTPYVQSPFLVVDTDKRGQEERDKLSYKNSYEAVLSDHY